MSTQPPRVIVEEAVFLAGRAPSLHNTQPWRWVFDGTTLRLYSVPERMLPATDTRGRQMIISCGITLDHLRVALAAAGWRTTVQRFPNPNRRDHLATVMFAPARIVTDAERERADVIVRRHADRLPFEPPAGWDAFEPVLRSTFDPADAVLDVLPDGSRPALARAAEFTASLRRYDSGYQAELQWWAGHVVAASGIPRGALLSEQERRRVPVGRTLPARTGEARRAGLDDHSTIMVLSTDSDAAPDLLRCGEALSTVLLECTVAGYVTCPLTHLTEQPRSRAIVSELTGRKELPQVLIRVGTAPGPDEGYALTPRRRVSEILEFESP